MKVAHENNISLVAAVYADISDSAKLDAKRLSRLKGERCCWSSTFCLEFEDCSELQQIDCTNKFVEENLRFENVETEKSPKECRKCSSNQSHCLPKVKKTRQRSLNERYMQK